MVVTVTLPPVCPQQSGSSMVKASDARCSGAVPTSVSLPLRQAWKPDCGGPLPVANAGEEMLWTTGVLHAVAPTTTPARRRTVLRSSVRGPSSIPMRSP